MNNFAKCWSNDSLTLFLLALPLMNCPWPTYLAASVPFQKASHRETYKWFQPHFDNRVKRYFQNIPYYQIQPWIPPVIFSFFQLGKLSQQWPDLYPGIMGSLVMCVSVYGVYTSEIASNLCFTALCGKSSGSSGWQAAATPFPPQSFPVPSTAAVVQPFSDHAVYTQINTHTQLLMHFRITKSVIFAWGVKKEK